MEGFKLRFPNIKGVRGSYKWCGVPCCRNTTVSTPEKLFLHLPRDPARRKAWVLAARRDAYSAKTSSAYYCEDHFEVPDCVENYRRIRLMGETTVLVSKTAMPTKFTCQADRASRTSSGTSRILPLKRRRQELVEEACIETADSPPEHLPIQETPPLPEELSKSVGCQTFYKSFCKSVGVQMQQPQCKTESQALSPVKWPSRTRTVGTMQTPEKQGKPRTWNPADIAVESDLNDPDYELKSSGEDDADVDFLQERLKMLSVERSQLLFRLKPKQYLGIPPDMYCLIDLLTEYGMTAQEVFIVLVKIKTADSFERVGDQVGLSGAQAGKIFSKTLPKVHNKIRQLIFWPPMERIVDNMPIAFRANYRDVSCIIDAFEIHIEKPTNAVRQSGSWSDYKGENTMKYIVAITPDGLVTWVSCGFGGRTSDTMIIKKSDFINGLPPGTKVMADRGFKGIDEHLKRKNCTLIRPPSVSSKDGALMSKDEVMETKRIASLRIHVERLIRRLREIKTLSMDSSVNLKFLPYLDMIVDVACGIVNLQGKLIK